MTEYVLRTGETVQVKEIQNGILPVRTIIKYPHTYPGETPRVSVVEVLEPVCVYSLVVVSGGWNYGAELRLTSREMVLNGAVRQ